MRPEPDAATASPVVAGIGPEVRDRALAAYLGLALGDALGATVEFMTPREIRHRHGLHREIVGGGWLRLAAGQVTDDTTMSLALGQGLLDGGLVGLQPVADAFARWLKSRPVDCGHTCRRGILRYLHQGTLQGPPNEGDAGNGALMRNLPVVLATLHDDALFERVSLAQARFTHHHPHSDAAVLGLGRLTRNAILGADRPQLAAQVSGWVAQHPVFRFEPYRGRASAYVVDTVQTVLHHWTGHGDFAGAVIATVNQGDDADTTGALAGMLAGACGGTAALPARWLQRLQPEVHQAISAQVDALLALAAATGGAPALAPGAPHPTGAGPDPVAGLAVRSLADRDPHASTAVKGLT